MTAPVTETEETATANGRVVRVIGPVVEEFATQYAGKLKVGKLNVDEHPAVAQRYNITGIPALLFFEGGAVVETVVGAVPKSTLQKKVDEVLGNA